MVNRIKLLREAKGLSMKYVADALRIPYTTYINYEKGYREPNSEMLIKLSSFFETSIDYLIGKNETVKGQSVPEERILSEGEFSHIKKYRQLPETGKQAVENMMDTMLSAQPTEADKVVQMPEKKKKTVLPIAGYGGGVDQIETDLSKEELLELFHKIKNLDKI